MGHHHLQNSSELALIYVCELQKLAIVAMKSLSIWLRSI